MKKRFCLLITALLLVFLIHSKLKTFDRHPDLLARPEYKEQLAATCSMIVNGRVGATGVLLDTGYIVTAAHLFDTDSDGIVLPYEIANTTISVRMYNRKEFPCHIVGIGLLDRKTNPTDDIAILRPEGEDLPKSFISLATYREIDDLPFGEPIFVIGRSDGLEPHITTGVISNPATSSGRQRVSATVTYGNSGGGVFSLETGKLLGIVTNMKASKRYTHVDVDIPRFSCYGNHLLGFMQVSSDIEYLDFLSQWGEFLDASNIRWMAVKTGNENSVQIKKKDTTLTFLFGGIVFGGLMMLGGVIWAILKSS